ncbi:hypothetical protein DL96DRAFT_1817305 [Flagelloscypha sp. PMI_526]|nr:hypothetical protein DL96DRAFT_1817305 [Flagelloscypha sp. PMI_526]
MFPRFRELPTDLQEYIVHWASDDYGEPGFNSELMLVCKDFMVWLVTLCHRAAHNHYRILPITGAHRLEGLLQTNIFRQTAARSVRVLFVTDVPTACSSLICEMLRMTSNLISFYLDIDGGFIFPDTLSLPRLRAVMAGGSDSLADVIHLSTGLARQLTHFAYAVNPALMLADLLRWLSQPLDSLSHVILHFTDQCADTLADWNALFRRTIDEVLPLLPQQLRVFIVHLEDVPDIQDSDDDLVNFIRGQLDRRVAFAPRNRSEDPLFVQYTGEVATAPLLLYDANETSIWASAEEFISKRDAQN